MRRVVLITVLMMCGALLACGDDDGTAGSAGSVAGSGGTSGSGGNGATGGVGATGGDSGTGGVGATGGASGSGGTGDSGVDAGGVGGDGGVDAGGSGGTGGGLSRCVAPTQNAMSGNTCRNAAPPALKLTTIVQTLRFPVSIKHAPDDNDRLFVVERTGAIQIVRDGAVLAQPFLTLTVQSGFSEQGLLDVAFDPNYATTGFFYVFYIANSTDLFNPYETHVVRYTVSSNDPDRADPDSAHEVFTITRDALNHNGGDLEFGPDGCLYISVGDGGGSNDQHGAIGNGQDNTQPRGKILRIDADNYPAVAPGNLTGANVYPHIWDTGLRNPWRFSFDRATGDLYIGDVGQGTWEEVNVEPKGTGKLNYGWRLMEGMHCRGQTGAGGGCDRTGLTLPVAEYRNPDDGNVIVGGHVYRGQNIPELQGRYFYADYERDRIWTFTWTGSDICDEYEVTDDLVLNGPTSFGEDASGELYVVTHGSGSNGRLYRIDAQ